jgi:hypothetical protein
MRKCFILIFAIIMMLGATGCGVINLGRWKGLEFSGKDEHYYMVKDIFLTAGSAYSPKEVFDHNINESVNLFFTPRNETNHYTAESIWYDPSGSEFRTIRLTYDKQKDQKKGDDWKDSGTTRVHSLSTKEMVDHKPGLWKVALFLEGKLVRKLSFTVR